jgi:hypothetical protein
MSKPNSKNIIYSLAALILIAAGCVGEVTKSQVSRLLSEDGGGWVGGGGGTQTGENNPWYLGLDSIPYCIEIAGDFPLSRSEVEKTIQSAFDEWKDAFEHYEVQGHVIGSEPPMPNITSRFRTGHFLDGKRRSLLASGRYIGSCSENTTGILRFQVGTLPERVKEYLNTRNGYIIGAAIRDSRPQDPFASGGIVWIAPQNFIGPVHTQSVMGADCTPVFPDWSSKRRLFILLVHELGHVFGVPHDSMPVMSAHIYEKLLSQHYYTNYDQLIERYPEEMFAHSGHVETSGHPLKPFSSGYTWVDERDEELGDKFMSLLEAPAEERWKRTSVKLSNPLMNQDEDGVYHLGGPQIEIEVLTRSGKFYRARSSYTFPGSEIGIDLTTNQWVDTGVWQRPGEPMVPTLRLFDLAEDVRSAVLKLPSGLTSLIQLKFDPTEQSLGLLFLPTGKMEDLTFINIIRTSNVEYTFYEKRKCTTIPTSNPSSNPSFRPSSVPSSYPSSYPSIYPSTYPSGLPSGYPSPVASRYPVASPSG